MARGPFLLDPPPGFQGFDPWQSVRITRRNLPHWRQDGATYFVTFRLADALPAKCVREIARAKRVWEREHPEPRTEEDWRDYARLITRQEEQWLDRGHGECWLAQPENANRVVTALTKFDSQRLHLGAYAVMPNHVHVIVRPLPGHELEGITKSWKGYTAREINEAVSRRGPFWQEESYDSIVRDAEHLYRVIRYIGDNPKKAGLAGKCPVWVREDWADAGFGFRSDEDES